MRTTVLVLILTAFWVLDGMSCMSDSAATRIAQTPTDSLPAVPGWTLVWNDEFSGPMIDSTKWGWEVNGDGGGNNELQYYTASSLNSFIEDGKLVIRAIKENYLGKQYTSARMRTKNKGDWKYGRFEARMKLPLGKGMWPAFWMLPTDWVYGGWPLSGEIDVMEVLGHETTITYGTIHWGAPYHQQSGGTDTLTSGTFADSYHTFATEWDSTGFKWYADGIHFFSTSMGSPFDQRFHILLNLAIGGNWPGSPDASTVFPQMMYVDYVRVYRKAN
ncbi:MAG: glycoside hydrolase family 16 protein [Ignavibacteriae bacterium]|nr:glycoside hydrolase family 16 protein [Ignavibacteriota bacterium]